MIVVYLAAAVGIILLAWWVSQLGRDRTGRAGPPGVPATVESLVAAGDTLAAIKLLRMQSGLGLKEARDAVEAFQAGRPLPPRPGVGTPPPGHAAAEADPMLREFLNAANLIAAIKRYRELTGLGLKESKDAVERMAGLDPPR